MKILYRRADVPNNDRLRYILSEYFDLDVDIRVTAKQVCASSIQPTSDRHKFNQEIIGWNTELRNHLANAQLRYTTLCADDRPNTDDVRDAADDMAFHAKAVCDELLLGHDRIVIQKADDATYVGTWLDDSLKKDIRNNPGMYVIMYAEVVPDIIAISSSNVWPDKYCQILLEYKFLGNDPWKRKCMLDELLSETMGKNVQAFITSQIDAYTGKGTFHQIVKSWNTNLITRHMAAVRSLREYKQDHPDYQKSDIRDLDKAVDKAASALTGPLMAHHDKAVIVYDELCKKFYIKPYLDETIRQDIQAHPGRYVIVNAALEII